MIAFVGGLIGLLVGVGLSRLIAVLAGWSTIVTVASILIAFLVSVAVGLAFGVYPAVRALEARPGQGAALRMTASTWYGYGSGCRVLGSLRDARSRARPRFARRAPCGFGGLIKRLRQHSAAALSRI